MTEQSQVEQPAEKPAPRAPRTIVGWPAWYNKHHRPEDLGPVIRLGLPLNINGHRAIWVEQKWPDGTRRYLLCDHLLAATSLPSTQGYDICPGLDGLCFERLRQLNDRFTKEPDPELRRAEAAGTQEILDRHIIIRVMLMVAEGTFVGFPIGGFMSPEAIGTILGLPNREMVLERLGHLTRNRVLALAADSLFIAGPGLYELAGRGAGESRVEQILGA